MKGLWVLPSRKRIARLTAFFYAATANAMTTPGVVLVQKDELASMRTEYDALALPVGWRILPTNANGFGDKHREVWGAVQGLDWIGIACDDLRPQTPLWDVTLLSHVSGKNIVSCNDALQAHARMSGITVFSGALVRAMGYLFPPGFWHTYVDNVWEDIGRATGCWCYVDGVKVLHDHPFTDQRLDPAKADDTSYKSYGQQARDQAAYAAWKQNDFTATCERVRQCQAA